MHTLLRIDICFHPFSGLLSMTRIRQVPVAVLWSQKLLRAQSRHVLLQAVKGRHDCMKKQQTSQEPTQIHMIYMWYHVICIDNVYAYSYYIIYIYVIRYTMIYSCITEKTRGFCVKGRSMSSSTIYLRTHRAHSLKLIWEIMGESCGSCHERSARKDLALQWSAVPGKAAGRGANSEKLLQDGNHISPV